jgi:hypothetical protein
MGRQADHVGRQLQVKPVPRPGWHPYRMRRACSQPMVLHDPTLLEPGPRRVNLALDPGQDLQHPPASLPRRAINPNTLRSNPANVTPGALISHDIGFINTIVINAGPGDNGFARRARDVVGTSRASTPDYGRSDAMAPGSERQGDGKRVGVAHLILGAPPTPGECIEVLCRQDDLAEEEHNLAQKGSYP